MVAIGVEMHWSQVVPYDFPYGDVHGKDATVDKKRAKLKKCLIALKMMKK